MRSGACGRGRGSNPFHFFGKKRYAFSRHPAASIVVPKQRQVLPPDIHQRRIRYPAAASTRTTPPTIAIVGSGRSGAAVVWSAVGVSAAGGAVPAGEAVCSGVGSPGVFSIPVIAKRENPGAVDGSSRSRAGEPLDGEPILSGRLYRLIKPPAGMPVPDARRRCTADGGRRIGSEPYCTPPSPAFSSVSPPLPISNGTELFQYRNVIIYEL